jgi:hypothetical protein
MRERPILFSGPMVRAILDGPKTQTRRPAPITALNFHQHDTGLLTWDVHFSRPTKGALASYSGCTVTQSQARSIIASQYCPYGQPGDRLWVRETWLDHVEAWAPGIKEVPILYRATAESRKPAGRKWFPSIHMPRWACRLVLEITDVRVELVQDISEEDARAEGFADRLSFMDAWEGLYAKTLGDALWGWSWVIGFKRLEIPA